MGAGGIDSTLRFDDDQEVDVSMTLFSISGAYFFQSGWTVRASVGALLDGSLQPTPQTSHDFETGFLASAGVEYSVRPNRGWAPSVDLSLFFGGLWTETLASSGNLKTDYSAYDARLGAMAGWSITGATFGYVAGRVFGGPVNWELGGEEVTGTDINHYQLAVGAAVQIAPVAIFAEWAPLGEKGWSAGLSATW